MRLFYFTTYFPYFNKKLQEHTEDYVIRGAENVAYNLALNLAKRGHEIVVFTTSADSRNTTENQNGIYIYRYRINLKVSTSAISISLLKDSIVKDFGNPDLVHIHVSVPIGDFAGMIYALRNNIPFIVTYHGDIEESSGNIFRKIGAYFYNKYILKRILNYANIIISPSRYYISESKILGEYRHKTIAIPNGIDLSKFNVIYSKEECREMLNLPTNERIILFVGSLLPRKGPDVLIRAVPYILREVSDVLVVFVGSGKMKHKLKELANKLGVSNHVKFQGFVEEILKPIYYKSADIFCLPSTMSTEVFPVVLLEASAAGLPMVVSDLNTFKCIINDGYNGIFTKRKDEKDLADAIIYLLENEDVRRRMGKNAKERVKYYSWNNITKVTEELYRRVLNGKDLYTWRMPWSTG